MFVLGNDTANTFEGPAKLQGPPGDASGHPDVLFKQVTATQMSC